MAIREVVIDGKTYRVEVQPAASGKRSRPVASSRDSHWTVRLESREFSLSSTALPVGALSLIIDGKSHTIRVERNGEGMRILLNGAVYDCTLHDPRSLRSRSRGSNADNAEKTVRASMPGKVVRLLAKAGESIAPGQGLLVIEAMKMQNEVRSAKGGVVKSLAVREGANVNAGDLLAVIE